MAVRRRGRVHCKVHLWLGLRDRDGLCRGGLHVGTRDVLTLEGTLRPGAVGRLVALPLAVWLLAA